jgi:hypothetical protein
MPIPKEYREIIKDLKSASDEGRVNWSTDRFNVSVQISESIIEIWGGEDSETERPFVSCSLKNAGFRSRDNALDTWFVEEGDPDYLLLFELYMNAKRQGLGIPGKLLEISKALKSSKKIGVKKGDPDKSEEDIPF